MSILIAVFFLFQVSALNLEIVWLVILIIGYVILFLADFQKKKNIYLMSK